MPLVPGPAEVVASNVNVRGQARLKSEVLTRVTKGQSVTVVEEIVRNNSGPEEPSAWAKIVLPPSAHVWVSSTFINTSNETVRPKKLNLRSGPGENYSVIGRLQGGDAVKPITTKGDWTEIEAPTNAYAFVAAQYLKQEAPAAACPHRRPPPEPAPAADHGGRGPARGAAADRSSRRAPADRDARDDQCAAAGPEAEPAVGGTAPAANCAARGHRARHDQHSGAVEVCAHQPARTAGTLITSTRPRRSWICGATRACGLS